jgi:hypothetical protein
MYAHPACISAWGGHYTIQAVAFDLLIAFSLLFPPHTRLPLYHPSSCNQIIIIWAENEVEHSAGCGRREDGQCGRSVEDIEQLIASPAFSPFGVLERVHLSADVHPLCAKSRVRSCPLTTHHCRAWAQVEASKMV